MRNAWFGILGLSVLGLVGWSSPARGGQAAAKARDTGADAKALAARIDLHIAAKWKVRHIKPAPLSDDAEFYRRISLDLIGRIPHILEIRDFIDDDRADKRRLWVEDLLQKKIEFGDTDMTFYARHFSNVWRHLFLPQSNNMQAPFFFASMETWLRDRLEKNTPYDEMVREILTTPLNARTNPNPLAFYQVNEFKPEVLAANSSRLFLGHKLECAQCHDHPFAKWSRKQFWEYAAFFAGSSPQQGDQPKVREIKITGTDKVVKARFLDESEPKWRDGVSARTILAEWITRADNPYFARATVNKVWEYFFGIGLIDPVDEETDENPPSHPELLDELAREFAAHHFDLKFLIRAIVFSRTYQLSSGLTDPSQLDPRVFARQAVRSLSPEQLFDSVAEAIEMDGRYAIEANGYNPYGPRTPRGQFLAKFPNQEKRTLAETSILQALFMMNGDFMARSMRLEGNKNLEYIANSTIAPEKRIEQLYLMTLSRKPAKAELDRLLKYVKGGGKVRDPKKAFEDVFWALMNSAEFMLNH
jgi:hypothetical protein